MRKTPPVCVHCSKRQRAVLRSLALLEGKTVVALLDELAEGYLARHPKRELARKMIEEQRS